MGIRVECDWCRERIEARNGYITLVVEGKVKGRDVGGPARVFCADECGQRLVALLEGNPGARVDMGMEWQLVAVGEVPREEDRPRRAGERAADVEDGRYSAIRTPPPRPILADAELKDFLGTFAPSARSTLSRALMDADVTTLEQLADLSDREMLEVRGIGLGTLDGVRAFVAEREKAREASQGPDGTPSSPLKRILQEEGRSQAWLAKHASIDQATVSRIVRHGLIPSREVMQRIADALSRTPDMLWPGVPA